MIIDGMQTRKSLVGNEWVIHYDAEDCGVDVRVTGSREPTSEDIQASAKTARAALTQYYREHRYDRDRAQD